MSARGWPFAGSDDALARVAAMPREEVNARANVIYIREARELAQTTLRNPYSVGGRGSVLEARLARAVLALLEVLAIAHDRRFSDEYLGNVIRARLRVPSRGEPTA